MKLIIGNKTYDRLKSVSFAPEIDMSLSTLPIGSFEAEVVTSDSISVAQFAELRDDLGSLWARYWVTYARCEAHDAAVVRVRAQSKLMLLDQVRMDASFHDGLSFARLMEVLMQEVEGYGTSDYSSVLYVDPAFAEATITGFFPAQTARERMQWACFAVGAYVRTWFTDKVMVLPLPEDGPLEIPVEKTYWRPKVAEADRVTGVRATYYDFDPVESEKPEGDSFYDGAYYIPYHTDEVSLSVQGLPEGMPPNVVTLDNVSIVNGDNVGEIASRLIGDYGNRRTVEMDVIDNGEFHPGQFVSFHVGERAMACGVIERASFSFGAMAKARLEIAGMQMVVGGTLVIVSMWGGMVLGRREYDWPVGAAYSLAMRYIHTTINKHEYVFRPTIAEVTGVMPAGGTTVTVPYAIALDKHKKVLHVVSVDEVQLVEAEHTDDGTTLTIEVAVIS